MTAVAGHAISRPRVAAPGTASLRTGFVLLGAMLAVAVFATIWLDDPNAQELTDSSLPPFSAGHPLGTDVLGRDLLTWCARGIVTSLTISMAVTFLSAVVGVCIGALSGYVGGWVDAVLSRIVDLQLAVPPILVFLAAAMVVPRNVFTMVLLLSSLAWVPFARLLRTHTIVERERGYIAAARLAGARRTNILINHLVPAAVTPIVVFSSLQLGGVMLYEAGLSFLGLGLEPPTASLGYMIAQGRDQLGSAWWIATVPGLFIVVLILAANLIGDGLRDRFHVDNGGY
jgi:peptide/nickel transport system permease protein